MGLEYEIPSVPHGPLPQLWLGAPTPHNIETMSVERTRNQCAGVRAQVKMVAHKAALPFSFCFSSCAGFPIFYHILRDPKSCLDGDNARSRKLVQSTPLDPPPERIYMTYRVVEVHGNKTQNSNYHVWAADGSQQAMI